MHIILASTSPRRKRLLKQLGIHFTCTESDYEEDNTLHLSPERLVLHHAKQKARSLKKKNATIIAADTLVTCKGNILGKPHTKENARKTLHLISGKTILVLTGICVINQTGKEHTAVEKTKVFIKKLTQKEIEEYIKTKEPLDKAGAFGIQGLGAMIVKKIEGDYNNIVGLPLYTLSQLLKKAKA